MSAKFNGNGSSISIKQTTRDGKGSYIDHLYAVFYHYISTPPSTDRNVIKAPATPTPLTVLDPNDPSKAIHYSRRIQSLSTQQFLEITRRFYKVDATGRLVKVVPDDIDSLLNDCAVAYWFMDDGSREKGGCGYRIATNCFSISDTYRLKDSLSSS